MIPWNFLFYDRNSFYANLHVSILIVLLLHIVVINNRSFRIISLRINFYCVSSVNGSHMQFLFMISEIEISLTRYDLHIRNQVSETDTKYIKYLKLTINLVLSICRT